MIRIVAYDVANPKRLRQVSRACEDYGFRVEKSVFECDLREEDFATLWHRLLKAINPSEDKLTAYRVCGGCDREVLTAGAVDRPQRVSCYLF